MHDLIVIGGGPAGTAAAITAARAGAGVLLLERGVYPRHKVCGEFVSAESLELLKQLLGSEPVALVSAAPRIFHSRIFVDGAELSAQVSPAAASVTRFDLDQALWNSAVHSGVDAREGSIVQSRSILTILAASALAACTDAPSTGPASAIQPNLSVGANQVVGGVFLRKIHHGRLLRAPRGIFGDLVQVWATARKFRELWPHSRLTELAENVATRARVPESDRRAGPATKWYSSCYSLLGVLGAFRLGWCRMMSRAGWGMSWQAIEKVGQ